MTRTDATTFADLHMRVVVGALVDRCRSEPGKAWMGDLRPAATAAGRRLRAERIAEARQVIVRSGTPGFAGLAEVRDIADRARRESLLEPEELSRIRSVIRAVGHVHDSLGGQSDVAPLIAAEAASLPVLEDVAVAIELTFEGFGGQGEGFGGQGGDPPSHSSSSGRIRDDATPALGELRRRSRVLHGRLRKRVDELVHEQGTAGALQDSYFTLRSERYVLPVRADRRTQVRGIIHGRSGSGQTVYVEPEELIPLNNDLKMLEAEVAEEERAILRNLSDDVRRVADDLVRGVAEAAALDGVFAAAHLAEEHDLEPAVEGEHPASLRLLEARNPVLLLQDHDVVANDISFPEGARWLILSGPNAGGKSVTLNTLGTLALMHALGLPVPAAPGSRLPHYSGVATVFGDAQDIESELSTFTGHVRRLWEVLDRARPGALILVDELMDGTDPEQGAALAQAVLEYASRKGLVGAVSTHYPRLKVLSEKVEGFRNARLVFDSRRAAPTYRLEIGEAASSEPFAVARRTGLAPEIVDRGIALAGPGWTAVEDLRGRLAEQVQEAETAREAALQARAEAEQERQAAGALREKIARGAEAHVRRSAERTLRRIDQALSEVRRIVRRLQSQPSAEGARRVRRRLSEIEREVRAEEEAVERLEADPSRVAGAAAPSPEPPAEAPPRPLAVGDEVLVRTVGRPGRVIALLGDEVEVQVGVLRMTVAREDAVQEGGGEPAHSSGRSTPTRLDATEPVAAMELDLRGQRVHEALARLDTELDRAFLAGRAELRVVHGHGTAALKRAVRAHLRTSPYVDRHAAEPQELGGDGATHVWLDL